MSDEQDSKKATGFALLTQSQRQELSAMGGRASQASGRGHRFSKEEARRAGVLGGRASQKKSREARERQGDS
jgi:hypothetical protein